MSDNAINGETHGDSKQPVEAEFDQTNGLAGNLEGDDGGSDVDEETADGRKPSLFSGIIDSDADLESDEDHDEKGYSEEGRE